MAALLAGLASGGGVQKQYIDEIFSAYTYHGNGSTQTITNGIDLAGKGGMVWIKRRNGVGSNLILNTVSGNTKLLMPDSSSATFTTTAPHIVSAFGINGFTLDNSSQAASNQLNDTFVSWAFANSPKFFKVDVVTKSAGSNLVIDLSPYMSTVGMVRVKRTDAAGSWYVWHRSLTAGKLLIGETTAAEATLGHITVVGTTLTLVNGVIADGTYHVEAYAHDTSAD